MGIAPFSSHPGLSGRVRLSGLPRINPRQSHRVREALQAVVSTTSPVFTRESIAA
jgi:hypothetical protein